MYGILHGLNIKGVELPEQFNNPFDYEPHKLCRRAWIDMLSWPMMNDTQSVLYRELSRGKMLGVLIVGKDNGDVGYLAAFSGQIAGSFYHVGFVPPVFDYLQYDSQFCQFERDVKSKAEWKEHYNDDIERIYKLEYAPQKAECERLISEAEQKMLTAKARRHAIRAKGNISADQEAAMIRESQYLKAELRRCRQRAKRILEPIEGRINKLKQQIDELSRCSRELSEQSQKWIFQNTILHNAKGEQLSVAEIFKQSVGKTPPSGAGECCAPKLLDYAFRNNLRPIAMAEFWYGESPRGEIRHHGCAYPACRSKCWPLLPWMLQGLDTQKAEPSAPPSAPIIIYENSDFCVVKKPAGMLSVPGKSSEPSVENFLQQHYGAAKGVRMAHRLDQATSGLMIATFGKEAYRQMQSLFGAREVYKTYMALIEADPNNYGFPSDGVINLPLMPDFDDRPRQMVSPYGLHAYTHYRVIESGEVSVTRVEFYPATGRTHQLRVHAASPQGLNAPIVGDRLYGRSLKNAPRLMLHASRLEFSYPGYERPFVFYWDAEF